MFGLMSNVRFTILGLIGYYLTPNWLKKKQQSSLILGSAMDPQQSRQGIIIFAFKATTCHQVCISLSIYVPSTIKPNLVLKLGLIVVFSLTNEKWNRINRG